MDPAAQPASLDPRYKFLTTLGRGGMGVVYKVLDRIEGQVVALKTLHPQGGSNGLGGQTLEADATDLLRFDQEIRALSLLHHEGIVRLFDVGHWEGRTYFTMEFLRGLPLQAFFNRPIPGATEIRWILRIFLKALDALECRNGCVHVDVIMTDEGPVVMDVLGAPAALRFPADVLLCAHGIDTIANALRFAAGEPPQFEAASSRGAALCWIPTRSGVVIEIRGIEEARAVSGIEEIMLEVKPGDAMRHIVDCESRDRVGYVLATGNDAEAAQCAARRALAVLDVVTQPSY